MREIQASGIFKVSDGRIVGAEGMNRKELGLPAHLKVFVRFLIYMPSGTSEGITGISGISGTEGVDGSEGCSGVVSGSVVSGSVDGGVTGSSVDGYVGLSGA